MGYFLEPQELSASVDVTEAATRPVPFRSHHAGLLVQADKLL